VQHEARLQGWLLIGTLQGVRDNIDQMLGPTKTTAPARRENARPRAENPETAMVNQTQEAQEASDRMDQLFLALQAVHNRMDEVRARGARVDYKLYAEWMGAYHHFQAAVEEWKRLTGQTRPKSPSTTRLPTL
jgi:hypothetical protein